MGLHADSESVSLRKGRRKSRLSSILKRGDSPRMPPIAWQDCALLMGWCMQTSETCVSEEKAKKVKVVQHIEKVVTHLGCLLSSRRDCHRGGEGRPLNMRYGWDMIRSDVLFITSVSWLNQLMPHEICLCNWDNAGLVWHGKWPKAGNGGKMENQMENSPQLDRGRTMAK